MHQREQMQAISARSCPITKQYGGGAGRWGSGIRKQPFGEPSLPCLPVGEPEVAYE